MEWDIDAEVKGLVTRGEYDQATTLVLRNFGPTIYRYIAARARDDTLASDAFARFAEELWAGLPGYRGTSGIRVWAYTVARNAVGQEQRKQQRERRRLREWTSTISSRLAEEMRTETRDYLRTEVKRRFQELALRLPAEEQSLLVLRVNARMSWEEIAKVHLDEADPVRVKREAARLRKRFQLVRDKLRELAKSEGLIGVDRG